MKLPSKDKILSDLVSIAEILTAVAVVSTKTEEIVNTSSKASHEINKMKSDNRYYKKPKRKQNGTIASIIDMIGRNRETEDVLEKLNNNLFDIKILLVIVAIMLIVLFVKSNFF